MIGPVLLTTLVSAWTLVNVMWLLGGRRSALLKGACSARLRLGCSLRAMLLHGRYCTISNISALGWLAKILWRRTVCTNGSVKEDLVCTARCISEPQCMRIGSDTLYYDKSNVRSQPDLSFKRARNEDTRASAIMRSVESIAHEPHQH